MLKVLAFAILVLVPGISFSQVNEQKLQDVAEQIRSSNRNPTPEQQEAFIFIFQNFAKEPGKTPTEVQQALAAYLQTVANSQDTGMRHLGLEASELSLKIALQYSRSTKAVVLQKLALRKDISLGARGSSIEQLDQANADDALTSIGKTLMKNQDSEEKYIAALAFTSSEYLDKDATEFLINELAPGKESRVQTIFTSDRQKLKKLYEKADPQGKDRLKLVFPGKDLK